MNYEFGPSFGLFRIRAELTQKGRVGRVRIAMNPETISYINIDKISE